MLYVSCPKCKQSLALPDEAAGKRASCSLCGLLFDVAFAGKATAPAPPERLAPAPNVFRMLAVLGSMAALVLIGAGAYYLFFGPTKTAKPLAVAVVVPDAATEQAEPAGVPAVASPSDSVPSPNPGVLVLGPEPPTESRKVRVFKEKVADYLEEARAAAKLMTLMPTVSEADSKATQITDLYTHIPDVPPDIDSTGSVGDMLKTINSSVVFCAGMVQYRVEFSKSPGTGFKGERESIKNCNDAAKKINQIADDIESLLGLE